MSEIPLVISLGSNISPQNVEKAVEWLSERLKNLSHSSIYMTPPVKHSGRPYSNAVVSAITIENIESLNTEFKQYEIANGRDNAARERGDVPIDIDIVVWDGEIVRPWDFRQNFFRIGASELAGSIVEE